MNKSSWQPFIDLSKISEATGINKKFLTKQKNLINVNKSSFNRFANKVGASSQSDRYALYQSIKSIVNKNQELNINNVEGVYFGRKQSYDMWKGYAKYVFPVFVKLIGQTSDGRIKNLTVSNRVSDELKTVYKLLGGKDNPNKYPVYAINNYGNNDPFPPENLEKFLTKNQNQNQNSVPIVVGGTIGLGLIGTGLYFLLGK